MADKYKNHLVSMKDITERIKDVICHEFPDKKVFDKNVAHELGFKAENFATNKSRNAIPYDELTAFCIRRKVNTNWLFFGIGEMEMIYA